MSDQITNHPFDEIEIGESKTWSKTITRDDLAMFALLTGDPGPQQIGSRGGLTAMGSWTGALATAVLGSKFPGPGTICVGETFRFHKEVSVGDSLTITVTARDKSPSTRMVIFDCECADGTGDKILSGTAEVIAPTEKFVGGAAAMPEARFRRRERYDQLMARSRGLPALPTAVIHPCDESSLTAAVEAKRAGLIMPILVGPEAKVASAAKECGINLRDYICIDVPHSHAAAEKAVELVRLGQAELLMKGSLHTDEVLSAVVKKETGLRTARRISHCFVMDVPSYPKPLVITDAAVNIFPTLEDKVDIIQNAIDLVRAFGLDRPRVAVLSAVETVTSKIASTLDAAALCKMADRGQITGAILDGPLAFDNAISSDAAAVKGIRSLVAGHADILVVPDLEAGNMVYKNLNFLADADGAGIVLGARVPIILTSRADSLRTKLASCAVASLYRHAQKTTTVSAAE